MALQIRRGLEADFIPDQMVSGELCVTTDTDRMFYKGGEVVEIQPKLTFDNAPIMDSGNIVTSGAVYNAIQEKLSSVMTFQGRTSYATIIALTDASIGDCFIDEVGKMWLCTENLDGEASEDAWVEFNVGVDYSFVASVYTTEWLQEQVDDIKASVNRTLVSSGTITPSDTSVPGTIAYQKIGNTVYVYPNGSFTISDYGTWHTVGTLPEAYRPIADLPYKTFFAQSDPTKKFLMSVLANGSVRVNAVGASFTGYYFNDYVQYFVPISWQTEVTNS